MKILRRKIALEDLRSRDEGLLYGTIVADFIYMKVQLSQTLDDMGMFIDLDYTPNGNECVQFGATIQVNNISCFDISETPPNDGTITVTPFNGEPPYTYSWSNGQTTQTATNLAPNNYTVTITDANGCILELEGEVISTPNAEPNATITATQEIDIYPEGTVIPITPSLPDPIFLCDGDTVTFAADSGFSVYQWQNGNGDIIATTESVVIDVSGTYHVTVINADGCIGESYPITIEFIEQVPPVITVTNLPAYATGSGTLNDPYVICNPHETTQALLEFGVNNPTAYDFFKWESAAVNGNPTTTLITEWCSPSNPCPQFLEVSSVCDIGFDETNLLASNTIWIAYDNGFADCSLLSEGGGS